MFEGKKVLITGGTGSLGQAITKKLLTTGVDIIRILSREEWKQVEMQSTFDDSRLRYLIGDVRDKERLYRALEDIDIVIHAAALKHVPIAEYNPFEAIKTNVTGSENLIDVCLERDVEVVLAIGTDKAVSPLNTYGGTKFLMERLFVSANYHKGYHKTRFVCVRYGNVLGSRGSVVPTFVNAIKSGKKIKVTDPNMTRFNISMNEAMDVILRGLQYGKGGEIFIPKLKAYKLGDLVDVLIELMKTKVEKEIINVRVGEKYHESLINKDETRITYETNTDYIIFEDPTQEPYSNPNLSCKKTALQGQYSSDKVDLLTKDEIKKLLIDEKLV